MTAPDMPVLLTPGEVAAIFRVHPRTTQRWAAQGRIACVRTPGGHRRYPAHQIRQLLKGGEPDDRTGD